MVTVNLSAIVEKARNDEISTTEAASAIAKEIEENLLPHVKEEKYIEELREIYDQFNIFDEDNDEIDSMIDDLETFAIANGVNIQL
jgi:cation transport regulator ChaC